MEKQIYNSVYPYNKNKKRKAPTYILYSKYSRIDTILLNCLDYYTQNKDNSFNKLLNILNPNENKNKNKIDKKRKLSLRLFDYFATIYAKKYNISIGKDFYNVSSEYKSQLCLYNKNFFDPFCRIQKKGNVEIVEIDIDIDPEKGEYFSSTDLALGLTTKSVALIHLHFENPKEKYKKQTIKTSLGQLNFFKWIISNNLYEYVLENIETITLSL